MNVSKINEGSFVVLLQMDPVFLYNIPNKPFEYIHRASDWNISAPNWHGKLLVTQTDSDSCQVQFKNTKGMFGVADITKREFNLSQVFQKVKDSSRYYTVQIKNIVSDDSAVYGIGFMNSKDISQLFQCLQDYFGSQNESLVSGEVWIKYTDHAHVKPDVADGFTKEIKCTDHKKVKTDVKNEAEKDVKCTVQAPLKVAKEETTNDLYTGHAPIKVDVKDVKLKDHAPVKVDVKDEITKDVKYTGHASIKVDVKDVKHKGKASVRVDVKDETTKDVKYNKHAPIKMDVQDVKYTGHASIKVDVKGETTNDVKFNDHALIKVDVKDETKKDLKYSGRPEKNIKVDIKESKCTERTPVKVNVSDKLNETTEAKIKMGQSSNECKKIKLDSTINDETTHDQDVNNRNNIKWPDPVSVPAMHGSRVAPTPPTVHETHTSIDEEEREKRRTGHKKFAEIPHRPPVSYIFRIPEHEAPRPSVGPLIAQPGKCDFRSPNETETGTSYQCRRTQQFMCMFCPLLTFPPKKQLNFLFKHWREVHHIFEPHTCKFCHLRFSTAAHRLKHMTAPHHVCSICPGEFEQWEQLNNHIIRHYTSARILNLDIGIEPKKATLSYKCLTCSLECESARFLQLHSEAHRKFHGKEGNSTYLCNVCGRNFDSEEILTMHLSIAHGERTYNNTSA